MTRPARQPIRAAGAGSPQRGSYSTASRYRPSDAKVGAARARSRDSRTAFAHCGGCLPSPTYTSVPTMLRTMCCSQALARRRELDALAAALDADRMQRAHRALRLALGRAERGEIVLAEQLRGRLAHRRDVQRRVVPARVARRQRRAHRPVHQHVAVGARARRIARMEIRRHALRPEHRHGFGQQRVHAAHPGRIGPFGLGVEVDHLRARVHAAVGAPRAGHATPARRRWPTAPLRARPAPCRRRAASASRGSGCRRIRFRVRFWSP